MKIMPLCVAGCLLALAGCTAKQDSAQNKAQEFDALHPEVAGSSVPRGSVDTVRSGTDIRVYHMGRRVDPANPKIMHEAGTMYVLADSGAWNLSPNYAPLDSRHNRVVTIPAPLTAEKQLEVKELQKTNTIMLQLGQALVQTRNMLIQSEKKATESEAAYKKSEAELISKLDALEKSYKLQAQKLAELQLKLEEKGIRQKP